MTMRIKGTREEAESDRDFYVVMESSGRYAIHVDITQEELESFLSVGGPYTYDEAIEMLQEAISSVK
jgi:hypothetical protein